MPFVFHNIGGGHRISRGMVIPVHHFLNLGIILLLGLLIIHIDGFDEIILGEIPIATSVQGSHLAIWILIGGCNLAAFDSHDDWLHVSLILQVP